MIKKLIKRHIRLRIAEHYRNLEVRELNRYSEWVFDAPTRQWLFRLRILCDCVNYPMSTNELDRISDFIVGKDEELG